MPSPAVDLTETRSVELMVVSWVFTGIAIITVALKLFARAHITKVVGWDDFFIFLALAFSIIAASMVTYSACLGLGRHTAAVLAEYGESRLVQTAKWQLMGYRSFSFPNISIAILVANLLDPNPIRTICLYGMSILQVVFAGVSVVLVFLQCRLTEKLWNTSVAGSCWSPDILNDFSYWLSAYTTLTDIVLAVVPISVFWGLQMRYSTKFGVCIMMGLTLLSAVVTIIKATHLYLLTNQTDPLFDVVPLVIWGLVEQNVVIVAACIPTLRPFFHLGFKDVTAATSSFGASKMIRSGRKPGCPRSCTKPYTGTYGSRFDIPLDDVVNKEYAESNNSRQGIWRTMDFSVESEGYHSV